MAFDLSWLIWTLALGFGLGWMAARLDLRQSQREQRASRRVYDRGLNLLLNDQHDQAIDAFIEVVQQDPDTTELHFALGNLFRRRGEVERAVRVHEYLLKRPHLSEGDRHRAQQALARDFMGAGLFDRAENAWKALAGTPFELESKLALLALSERSRQWPEAAALALWLEETGTGSYRTRMAHHWCEVALEAQTQGAVLREMSEDEALKRAHAAAPHAPRPIIMAGQTALRHGDASTALTLWAPLCLDKVESFALIASDYAQTALRLHRGAEALAHCLSYYDARPSLAVLEALRLLDEDGHPRRLRTHLRRLPTPRSAKALLTLDASRLASAPAPAGFSPAPNSAQPTAAPDVRDDLNDIVSALDASGQTLGRYRCAACGFEAQRHFWQCPGCLNWDTYPAVCVDEV
jgi:lipopolysaccharide biosynthesis regulator YciM